MIIKYDKTEYSRVTHEIDIPDTKNVFLKGTNPYDGLSTYLGIWTNEKYLVVINMISNRNISYDYSLEKAGNTEMDIKKFLEHSKNVKIISRDEFQKKLNNFIEIVKM